MVRASKLIGEQEILIKIASGDTEAFYFMGMMDRAKAAIERITSNTSGWAKPLEITSRFGNKAFINGLFTGLITQAVELENGTTNTRMIHCSFSEKFLTDQYYPVRDAQGIVSIVDDKIKATNSAGQEKTYVIRECHPDETIGLLRCVLGEYEA